MTHTLRWLLFRACDRQTPASFSPPNSSPTCVRRGTQTHDLTPAAVGGPADSERIESLTRNDGMCACVLMEALCWTAVDSGSVQCRPGDRGSLVCLWANAMGRPPTHLRDGGVVRVSGHREPLSTPPARPASCGEWVARRRPS